MKKQPGPKDRVIAEKTSAGLFARDELVPLHQLEPLLGSGPDVAKEHSCLWDKADEHRVRVLKLLISHEKSRCRIHQKCDEDSCNDCQQSSTNPESVGKTVSPTTLRREEGDEKQNECDSNRTQQTVMLH